jgi:hypothetical protein
MLKRLLLISLISIVPIQAWAALDMSMKHQINGSGVEAQTQTQTQAKWEQFQWWVIAVLLAVVGWSLGLVFA